MKTLHTCKQIMMYALLLGMFFSASGPLICVPHKKVHIQRNRQDNAEVVDLSELSQEQRDAMNKILSSIGARAIRDDALSYPGSKPNELVGSIHSATLKSIQKCLCAIKKCLDELKEQDPADFPISKICEIDMNIGDRDDILPTPNAILDVNTTTTYTVIQWLKAIYQKVK